MASGIISLKRENNEFKAGYGLLKHDLPELLERVSLLHYREREYLDTLQYSRRKQSYLLGRIACKKALFMLTTQKPETIFVDFGVFQFPVVKYVRDLNLQVGITHCEDVGLALAFPEEHPMGIDVEKIDAEKTETLESQITSGEKAIISKMVLPVATAYTILWTIKESLSKVLKTGFMTDFKFFEVQSLVPIGNSYESIFAYHGQYKAISYVLNNHVCTIVIPKNTTADLSEFRASLDRVTGALQTG